MSFQRSRLRDNRYEAFRVRLLGPLEDEIISHGVLVQKAKIIESSQTATRANIPGADHKIERHEIVKPVEVMKGKLISGESSVPNSQHEGGETRNPESEEKYPLTEQMDIRSEKPKFYRQKSFMILDDCELLIEEQDRRLKRIWSHLTISGDLDDEDKLDGEILAAEKAVSEIKGKIDEAINAAQSEEERAEVNKIREKFLMKLDEQIEDLYALEQHHIAHLVSELVGGAGDAFHAYALGASAVATEQTETMAESAATASEWVGVPAFFIRGLLSAYEANRIWNEKQKTFDRNTRFVVAAANSALSSGLAVLGTAYLLKAGLLATALAATVTPVVIAATVALIYLINTSRDVYQIHHTHALINKYQNRIDRGEDTERNRELLRILKQAQRKHWVQFGTDFMMMAGAGLLIGAAVAATILTGGTALAFGLTVAGTAVMGATAVSRLIASAKSRMHNKHESAGHENHMEVDREHGDSHANTVAISSKLQESPHRQRSFMTFSVSNLFVPHEGSKKNLETLHESESQQKSTVPGPSAGANEDSPTQSDSTSFESAHPKSPGNKRS